MQTINVTLSLLGADDAIEASMVSSEPAAVRFGAPVQRQLSVRNLSGSNLDLRISTEVTGPASGKFTVSVLEDSFQLQPNESKLVQVTCEATAPAFAADTATATLIVETI